MKLLSIISLLLLLNSLIADGVWQKTPLRFKQKKNLVIAGDMIRLQCEYVQQIDKPIVVEAEEATVIELQKRSRRIIKDKNSSGGAYLEHVKYLEIKFNVVTPGKYQSRLLAYFPLKSSWMHHEKIDSGALLSVWDSRKGEPKVWEWTKGPVYDLKKGEHRYIFPSPTAFCGGARLDKVALIPLFETKTKINYNELKLSTQVMADCGEAFTKQLQLKEVGAWKIDFEVEKNEGDARVEYSYDNRHWQVLKPSAIHELPERKPQYLQIRFKLQCASERKSPWIQGLAFYIIRNKTTTKKRRNNYEQIN